jgi:hypothetical protein
MRKIQAKTGGTPTLLPPFFAHRQPYSVKVLKTSPKQDTKKLRKKQEEMRLEVILEERRIYFEEGSCYSFAQSASSVASCVVMGCTNSLTHSLLFVAD